MKLSPKTLEKLREIINGDEKGHYRKGPELVNFFNQLGFQDTYSYRGGFPSRKEYTDDRLRRINDSPNMDKCIKMTFEVADFATEIEELDRLIYEFNQQLKFDEWQVVRDNGTITFKRVVLNVPQTYPMSSETSEEKFLQQSFVVDLDKLQLESGFSEIVKQRLNEVEACIKTKASLAAVVMIGSILEGVLLGTALAYPRQFNQAKSAPKDRDNKVRQFPEWTLSTMIDVAAELDILRKDVQTFSHYVRDFRNYIHPYAQMASKFSPDEHTALICWQVLKAAIYQIGAYQTKNRK